MKSDTTPEAQKLDEKNYAEMTGAERVREAFQLSDEERAVTRARIRSEQPHLSEQEVTLELIYEYYGMRFKVIDGVITEC